MSESLSLDINGQNSTGGSYGYTSEWTRKQKRCYQRALTLMEYYLSNGYQCAWVTLTTARGGDIDKLTYNHQRLRQRIGSVLGFRGIEYFQIKTAEGNGVIHTIWAWKKGLGEKTRNFFIPQAWLSLAWERIHGAKIVDIRKVRSGSSSKKRLTKYLVTQYVTEQKGFINISWSYRRSFGFPLMKVWRAFCRAYEGARPKERNRSWAYFLRGEKFLIQDGLKYFSFQTARMYFLLLRRQGLKKDRVNVYDFAVETG